jgi:hypothetical protein
MLRVNVVSWADPRFSGVAISLLNRNLDDGIMEMIYFRALAIWPHRMEEFAFEDINEFRSEETKKDAVEAKRSTASPATAWIGEVWGHRHSSFTPGRYKLDLEMSPWDGGAISGISIDDFQTSELEWRLP